MKAKSSIYHYRKLHGLGQKELAGKLGIDPVSLWRYENFKSCPRGQIRVAIAKLIEKSPGQILDEYLSARRSA